MFIILLLGSFLIAPWALAASSAQVGTARISFNHLRDNAYSLAIQNDGKILVAGATFNGKDHDALVLRLLPDGSLDTRFGNGGAVTFDSGKGDDRAYSISIRWDGKIYVAGQTHNGANSDFAVWRIQSTGQIDKQFARGGLARVDFGKGDDVAMSISIQNDGKALVGGTAQGLKDKDFALAKFLSDGAPDPGFGQTGKMVTGLGDIEERSGNESGYSVIALSSGKIIQVGFSEVSLQSVMSVVRYLNDGRLDSSFGKKGTLFPYFPGKDMKAFAASLDSSERLIVAGNYTEKNKTESAVMRIAPDGGIDYEFGTKGIANVPFSNPSSTIYAVEPDAAGRIVVIGSTGSSEKMSVFVARFNDRGKLDTSFANQGSLILDGTGKYDAAYALAFQADGRLLLGGVSGEDSGYQVLLASLSDKGKLDPSFGAQQKGVQKVVPNQDFALPKSFSIQKK